MTRVGSPPYAARPWWELSRPVLAIVTKLAADFPDGEGFSAVAAGTLSRIPEVIAGSVPLGTEPRERELVGGPLGLWRSNYWIK